MTRNIPVPLQTIVARFARLPGLGAKSALRIAMALLKYPEEEIKAFGKNIYELRDRVHLCSRCGGFADTDPCAICQAPNRERAILCLVPEWDAMLALEEGGFYNGQYMILGGLVAPLDHSPAENLELNRLLSRLKEGEVRELIFALGSTVEAENTASWLCDQIKTAHLAEQIRITRLAQGIPLGAEVKYMDRETLYQALHFRQDFFQ